MNDTGELGVLSLNLQWGGFGTDGGTARLDKSITAIRESGAQIVCLQEVTGLPAGPLENPGWDIPLAERDRITAEAASRAHNAARRHLHHIAARAGMTPVLGPPVPGQWRRMYTAILIREDDGVTITETGPPPMAVPGAENPAWTQATARFPGIPCPVAFYSVHLPARTGMEQLRQAQRLANIVAQNGMLAHIAGDMNSIPRTDRPSDEELAGMNPHLRPVRMVLDGGPLRPDHSVYDTLTGTGLTDIAASLPSGRRVPPGLLPTGKAGSRIDLHLATGELAEAATGFRQFVTGGSDHDATMTVYDRAVLALARPPGPRD